MKKIFISILFFLMLAVSAEAVIQTSLVTNSTTIGSWQTSNIATLTGGQETSLKNLYINVSGTNANIRIQVQIGTTIDGVVTWCNTTDFTIVESGGTWTYTLLGAAVGTIVTIPFVLADNSLARKVRIRYYITVGEINKIMLETSN